MTLAFARNNCHKLGTEVMMGRKASLSSFPSVSTYSHGFHSRRKVYRSVLMCTEVGVAVGFKEGEVRLRVELKRNSLPVMGTTGLSNGPNVFQANFHDLITSCGPNCFTNAVGRKV